MTYAHGCRLQAAASIKQTRSEAQLCRSAEALLKPHHILPCSGECLRVQVYQSVWGGITWDEVLLFLCLSLKNLVSSIFSNSLLVTNIPPEISCVICHYTDWRPQSGCLSSECPGSKQTGTAFPLDSSRSGRLA